MVTQQDTDRLLIILIIIRQHLKDTLGQNSTRLSNYLVILIHLDTIVVRWSCGLEHIRHRTIIHLQMPQK